MSHFQELTALLVERRRIPMKQYGAHFTVEDNQGHDWNEASNYQSSNFKTSCQAYKPTCLILWLTRRGKRRDFSVLKGKQPV